MILTTEQKVRWFKLTRVPKLGPVKILRLFSLVKNVDEIFSMSDNELLATRCFSEPMLSDFHNLKNASDENFLKAIDECGENNIKILPIIDPEYPSFLKVIPYPPLTLFLKGDTGLLYKKKVAIVGSRKADEHSKKWAYGLAQDLVKLDFTVVSGGAVGVDYSAHIGALDAKGKTICILGSGFFKMFPEKHLELFTEIGKKGLLISEHLPNFPGSNIALVQRNRITSGISNALVMVASGERGGAMVQTKMAFEQKIPIFCPEMSLNLKPNEGISQVINEWKGIEIRNCDDIFTSLLKLKKEEKLPSKIAPFV
ncbi:DNA-protecting protein DprA [Candidatus Woesearchaeota archaeon]|nr:DNA-protecting protein DprA [Candidatus Woesearchaeota archaeon]